MTFHDVVVALLWVAFASVFLSLIVLMWLLILTLRDTLRTAPRCACGLHDLDDLDDDDEDEQWRHGPVLCCPRDEVI